MKSSKLPIILIAIVAAIAATVFFVRRSSNPTAAASELRIGFEVETTSLDPSRVNDAYISRVIGQVFEGLTTLDESNEVVPALADSYETTNGGSRWVFSIRPGVKFHPHAMFGAGNTREVTAEDVVFSWTRLLAKDSTAAYAISGVIKGTGEVAEGKSAVVSGFEVIDAHHLAVELVAPDPLFPRRLTSVILAVVPKEIAALPAGQLFGKETTIGTGPFQVASRTDTEVVLTKNKDYWRAGSGNIERLVFKVVKDDAIRLAAARNGELDFLNVPLLLSSTVGESKGGTLALKAGWDHHRVETFSTFNSAFLGLNCLRLDTPVRRALRQATDRSAIIQTLFSGVVKPSAGPVPLAFPGFKEPVDAAAKPDLEAARRSLADSAYDRVRPLEILVHEKEASEQVGQLLQAQFQALGLTVKVTRVDYATIIPRMVKGDFDAALLSFEYVYSTPMPIVEGLLNSARIPAPNFWQYKNPSVDQAIASFATAKDATEANTIASQIVALIQDDPNAVYLYQAQSPCIMDQRLSGLRINGHSVPLFSTATLSTPNTR